MSTIPEQRTSQLDQPQVVLRLLVIAHPYRSTLRQPPQCPLHHPAPRRVLFFLMLIKFLFADSSHVARVAMLLDRRLAGRMVVSFIQTQVLRLGFARLRSLDDNG